MINPPIPEKKNGSCMEVRLNSPRGKFKRTNVAGDQVDLTPKVDIPGASFIEEEIEKLTLTQLKLCMVKMPLYKSKWL